jgi:hypothetical protein
MTIGGSIFLIAVGAILYFATNVRVAHVSIDTDRRGPDEPRY